MTTHWPQAQDSDTVPTHAPLRSVVAELFDTAMKRFLSLSLAWTLFAAGAAILHAGEKPNLLFICVDDLKPALSAYGDTFAKTPNIDRFATRGVLFERAYCNQAVCAPSRNALMTGLRPQTLGIYDLATNFREARPDAVTLAQHFKKAGYRTEAMGKIFHVGHGNHDDSASWSVPHFQPKASTYVHPEETGTRGAPYERVDVPDDTYVDGQIANEAVQRLRAAKDRSEPFFIAVGFIRPHLPFCAPKKYWDLHDRNALPLAPRRTPPDGAPKFAPTNWVELRNYSGIPAEGPLDDTMQRTLVHGYQAAVSYADAQIGRVLAALDETGLAAHTIVVLWGDHGWHLGDHGMWCKHTNYEQAARIPLIIAAPGIQGGVKTRALVETVDLYPTLAELAGLAAPGGLDGKSFAGLLRDPASKARESITHVYPRPGGLLGRAIRTERYRLVEWKQPGSPADTAVCELYDYQNDPLETRNLADAQPEVLAKLRAILAQQPEARPQISRKATVAKAAKVDPQRERLFIDRDTNHNGKLSKAEFMAAQKDPELGERRFNAFDANMDGVLSRDEFVNRGK